MKSGPFQQVRRVRYSRKCSSFVCLARSSQISRQLDFRIEQCSPDEVARLFIQVVPHIPFAIHEILELAQDRLHDSDGLL